MRGTRWLLLLAILLIAGGTAAIFKFQRAFVQTHQVQRPPGIPDFTNSVAIDYEWAQSTAGHSDVRVRAKKSRQIGDTSRFELEGVELSLFQKDHQHYDLVKSSKAEFDKGEGRMFSEGDVEITLNVPVEGTSPQQLTHIKTSAVTFESKSGKAVTDKPASFEFNGGEGKCVGAAYDPNTHELHLLHAVDMNLRGKRPKSQPMHVLSGELTYREAGSHISLAPWAKMQRAHTLIEAGPSEIFLKDKVIQAIDAQHGHGTDHEPKRDLDYAADELHLSYNEDGELQKIAGRNNARLTSSSDGSRTNMTGATVDLDFNQQDHEATLTHVLANGNAVIESRPIVTDKRQTLPETKILRSNTVEVHMRPGGKELERVQTHAPGVFEFLPNEAHQHRRLLHGERMTLNYGAQNQLQDFSAVNTTTETYPSAAEKKGASVSKTASVHLTADFDSRSGQMKHMKQWDQFHYEDGDRRATAVSATLDQEKDLMDLVEHARVWDATGSTDADHITLAQKTGSFTADGHVNTSRLPEKKKASSDMLDGDEPTQGQARRMTSANRNKLVHYEGGAVLWQGANRIQADVIDLDRDSHSLVADGKVVTQFLDSNNNDQSGIIPAKPPAEPVFSITHASHLTYTESDRLAHYTGGVTFDRPGLTVKSQDLRAWMNPKDSKEDSKINRAFADGQVIITEETALRQRRGTGEHSEYYTAEDRILLKGGDPELVDSKKGSSKGSELTYFTNDDRLLISGEPQKPVKSKLHRKT